MAINVEGEWETVSPDEKLSFLCEEGITGMSKDENKSNTKSIKPLN